VSELPGAPAESRALAGEAERGVDREVIEPCICISVFFQFGQRPPDLEAGFPDTNRPGQPNSMNKRGRL